MDNTQDSGCLHDHTDIWYWKDMALNLQEKLEASKRDADEFRVQSRELEAEFELQINDLERDKRELTFMVQKLTEENNLLKVKLHSLQDENHSHLTKVEDEMKKVKKNCDYLQNYIRKMEQTNDDLERNKRLMTTSIEDLETRLHEVIEYNTILEVEVRANDSLLETVQRLKDEVRDLHQDDLVKQKSLANTKYTHISESAAFPVSQSPMAKVKPIQLVSAVTDRETADQTPRDIEVDKVLSGSSMNQKLNKSEPNLSELGPLSSSFSDFFRKVGMQAKAFKSWSITTTRSRIRQSQLIQNFPNMSRKLFSSKNFDL